MSREEKLNKILEMTKEIFDIYLKEEYIEEKDIDKLYINTKIMLESLKELGDKDDKGMEHISITNNDE